MIKINQGRNGNKTEVQGKMGELEFCHANQSRNCAHYSGIYFRIVTQCVRVHQWRLLTVEI